MFTLYPIFFVLTIVRGKKAREFLFFVRKKEVWGSGFLGFSFLCAPHFELSPQTLLLQPTRPRHPHGTQEVPLSAAAFLPWHGSWSPVA